MLMICQNMSRFDKQMGKRIFVHCHAGTGRTGLVIASYLYYSGMVATGAECVAKVKTQRKGSLSRRAQSDFVVAYCHWLDARRRSFFPSEEDGLTYGQMMRTN